MNHPIVVHPFTIPIPLDSLHFEISGFGIAVLMAFLMARLVSERELLRRGYDFEARHLADVMFAAVAGTLLGGKLYYVAFITHDVHTLISRGGFVYWGGFIGAVIACWLAGIERVRRAPAARPAAHAVAAGDFAQEAS
jgi:phosphatidylglycerol:prolipoprotein diacylglycerol transferase